jgi:hypothetical protein
VPNKVKASVRQLPLKLIAHVALGVLVGLVIGLLCGQKSNPDPRYTLASQAELAAAKDAISDQFKAASSTGCTDSSDPIKPADRQAVFDKYLRVNKYANRAVIRGCNDIDKLLIKNPVTDKWEKTSINISLDTSANPAWQVECLIDDITKADDQVRSENSSIDTGNLVGCRIIKEREQVVDILSKSGTFKRSEIKQEDIDTYINGGESFYNN